jgi:hypothetical protein
MHRLLRCTGIQAGHEEVWRQNGFNGWGEWEVEVTPWALQTEQEVFGVVEAYKCLQVRHPLKVVGSLAVTEVVTGVDSVEKAAAWYQSFLESWVEEVDYVYRIEDMGTPVAYKGLLERLFPNRVFLSDHLAAALAYVPADYNTRPHPTPTWNDVPEGLQELGHGFGY